MGKLCLLLWEHYLGKDTNRRYDFLHNHVLLVLQTGGGLQMIDGAVTTRCYHRSGMQGAFTINLSLSTTPTLKVNTLLPLGIE
jgi:hypothetical protein